MNELNTEQLRDANPSMFNAQDEDLKTAEQVLQALEDEAEGWLEENLRVSKEAVKEKRGVR